MRWTFLFAVAACGPEVSPRGVADCVLTELHSVPDAEEPFLDAEERFDAMGRTVLRRDRRTTRETLVERRFDGDRVLTERATVWLEEGSEAERQTHHYNDAGLRVRTDIDVSFDGAPFERSSAWTFTFDGQGLPTGGTWDDGDDGSVDGFREEEWTEQLFGWVVEIDESFFGVPGRLRREELDDQRRLLWRQEDQDRDGNADLTEQLEWEADAIVRRDVAGPDIFDESCVFTLEDGVRVGSTCWNEFYPGLFRTRSYDLGDPARPWGGLAVYEVNGETEVLEVVDMTWDCPG